MNRDQEYVINSNVNLPPGQNTQSSLEACK